MTVKGSWHRPHDHATYARNMERIFPPRNKDAERMYLPVNLSGLIAQWEVWLWPDWENGGFMASCPKAAGCNGYGLTRDDALEDLRKVLTDYTQKNRKRRKK